MRESIFYFTTKGEYDKMLTEILNTGAEFRIITKGLPTDFIGHFEVNGLFETEVHDIYDTLFD